MPKVEYFRYRIEVAEDGLAVTGPGLQEQLPFTGPWWQSSPTDLFIQRDINAALGVMEKSFSKNTGHPPYKFYTKNEGLIQIRIKSPRIARAVGHPGEMVHYMRMADKSYFDALHNTKNRNLICMLAPTLYNIPLWIDGIEPKSVEKIDEFTSIIHYGNLMGTPSPETKHANS